MSYSPYRILLEQRKRLLFSPFRLVVLDFDCTVTNSTLCGKGDVFDASTVIEVTPFRNFVLYLVSIGVKVAIASYGRKRIILDLMNQVFRDLNPFNASNVITPTDVSLRFGINWRECLLPPPGYNKNNMLEILREGTESVLMIDDAEINVANAILAGYQGIIAPACQGFTRTLEKVLRVLMSHNPVIYLQIDRELAEFIQTFTGN